MPIRGCSVRIDKSGMSLNEMEGNGVEFLEFLVGQWNK